MNIIEYNKDIIKKYLKKKNIKIKNIEYIFSKIEIGKKREYPYASIDKENSYKIIISEDIPKEDMYKWINHEMIHVIANNQPTINDVNVGGIIIEDKEKNIWIGQYLNEAITEYISQAIINSKYSDYYDKYIEELKNIISIIGEDVILNAYFTNNLSLIVDTLADKTGKSKSEIFEHINSIDYLYDNEKN